MAPVTRRDFNLRLAGVGALAASESALMSGCAAGTADHTTLPTAPDYYPSYRDGKPQGPNDFKSHQEDEGNVPGEDYWFVNGVPVVGTSNGFVKISSYYRGTGNTVAIFDGHFTHSFLHLEEVFVHLSEPVRRGQVLGRLGETGYGATIPHLHFDVEESEEMYRLLIQSEGDHLHAYSQARDRGVPFSNNGYMIDPASLSPDPERLDRALRKPLFEYPWDYFTDHDAAFFDLVQQVNNEIDPEKRNALLRQLRQTAVLTSPFIGIDPAVIRRAIEANPELEQLILAYYGRFLG